jgi:hypothetical protein
MVRVAVVVAEVVLAQAVAAYVTRAQAVAPLAVALAVALSGRQVQTGVQPDRLVVARQREQVALDLLEAVAARVRDEAPNATTIEKTQGVIIGDTGGTGRSSRWGSPSSLARATRRQ